MLVLYLITRLRHQPETKWAMVTSFNPFPSWCVEWFMKSQTPDLSNLTAARVDFHFVRSRIDDNPHLRAGYKDMMEATLDPYLKAVMVDGDPDAALGGLMYFDRAVVEALADRCPDPEERIPTMVLPGMPADGEVLIWERPMTGERYYGGADTADGKGEALLGMAQKGGSDRNSAALYKLSTNEQVAAIYGRQEEHVFAKLLYDWGMAYNGALLCVERNRPAVLSNLRGNHYPHLYFTEKVADQHLVQVVNPVRQLQYGYDVNVTTRPVFLSQLRESLHGRVLKPKDKRLTQELLNFLAGEKPQAATGQHDDTVFAHGHADQARRALRTGRGSGQGRRFDVSPMTMR